MTSAAPKRLRFPRAIARALAQFVEAVTPFGVVDNALLGGGTVLAARWHHRLSTDLDFFLPYAKFNDSIVEHERELADALREVAFGTLVTPLHMQCVMKDSEVEVSVSVASHSTEDAMEPSERAEGGVRTQSSSAILTGKMAGRMMRQGRVTVRDVYDLCVAERRDVGALMAAAKTVPAGALVRTAEMLETDLEGSRRMKPLIDPAHSDIAENLASHGRRVLLSLAEQVAAAREPKRRTGIEKE